MYELMYWCWPHEVELAQTGSAACQDSLASTTFRSNRIVLKSGSEVYYQVYWIWGLLEGTCVQFNIKYYPWLALDNIFGAITWATIRGCLCWAWVCLEETKVCPKARFHKHWAQGQINKMPQTSWDLTLHVSTGRLPIIFSLLKSPWWYTSKVEWWLTDWYRF